MSSRNGRAGGGQLATTSFKHTYFVDFEYRSDAGSRPAPVCMVVLELESGKIWRYDRAALLALSSAPFETGHDAVMVAYAAQAELGCMLALQWAMPQNVIDLYAEFRNQTNGRVIGASLLNALAIHNLAHISVGEKEDGRALATIGPANAQEWTQLLDYCESDVRALSELYRLMSPKIAFAHALIRGRYGKAVACMEHVGVPVDSKLLKQIDRAWRHVRKQLITEVDQHYGVYLNGVFKADRFSRWLRSQDILWPRLESDFLDLSDDAFKRVAERHPVLGPLRELRQCLDQVDISRLRVGPDGRTRTSLRPYASVTGRNQPSTTAFVFGTAKWIRGLIRPAEGYGCAYIDFTSQEIGLAAGLSQDERLTAAYNEADVYLAFAKQAKLVPADATKESHGLVRERCKAVVLGQNYGMGANAIALQAGIPVSEARELIRLHRAMYRTFWEWSQASVTSGLLTGRMQSVFGWQRHVSSRDKTTSLMNYPMQANGAEMMRLAAIGATEAGIEVNAPVHDAFLITAPMERLEGDVALMREIMTEAGRVVSGLPIKTEAKLFRFPDRYMEEKGIDMWNRVVRLIGAPKEQL